LPLRLIEEFLKETLTGSHKIQEKKKIKDKQLFHRFMTGLQNPKNCNKSLQKKLKEKRVTFKRLSQEMVEEMFNLSRLDLVI
jgi:predicted house-cleaning NTP pyrophosphatase (Maf/HAM1 superfamily)